MSFQLDLGAMALGAGLAAGFFLVQGLVDLWLTRPRISTEETSSTEDRLPVADALRPPHVVHPRDGK